MTVTKMERRTPRTSETSARIAAEIRAEAARQGRSVRELARDMDVSQPWLSRRVSVTADVDLKVNEIEDIAAALGVPTRQLLTAAGWPGSPPPAVAAAGGDVTQRYYIGAAA